MEASSTSESDSRWWYVGGVMLLGAGAAAVAWRFWPTSEEKTTSASTEGEKVVKGAIVVQEVKQSVEEQPLSREVRATDNLFPFSFEDYKVGLSKLHQCFCGRSAGQGCALSRCASCRAVYYCMPEHQRLAWSSPPHLHKNFCPQVGRLLDGGFQAIEGFMAKYAPQNIQHLGLSAVLEGWSVICAALERKNFLNAYEEARLVHWAGTCHAMLCGQLMKEQLKPGFDLVEFFRPSINFFENVLVISSRSDRRCEVQPFANFELFGLWSSLGMAMKEVNPTRMEALLSESARRYGLPAVRDLLELIVTENEHVDQNMCLQSLQQWIQSVVTVLTQRRADFAAAEEVVVMLEEQVKQDDPPVAVVELAVFTRCLFDAAVEAHAEVRRKNGNTPDTAWGKEMFETYQAVRQELLRAKMTEAFPDVMAEAEGAAAGGEQR